jgi:hypothetical protein
MPDSEDYVWRPVLAGLCHYESLYDGTVGLVDIARMNDALDVKAENERRHHEYMKRQNG